MTPGTWLRTLVHLTPRQVLYQGIRRLRGPARRPASTTREGLTAIATAMPPPSAEGAVDPRSEAGAVRLLEHPPYDPCADGWTPDADPLYCYTLHYHGWLARLPLARARAQVEHWIEHHREGVGWEPYPTAMRVLHWLGWLGQHESHLDATARRRIFGSLAAQLEHLRLHVEHHLGGNHVWTDLAALCAAGLSLEGPGAPPLQQLLPIFAGVVEAQLDPDGVHRERTPTYHCLLAEQLAGVVALGPARVNAPAGARLEAALERMLAVLPAFTHPDGDIALWNDSQRAAPVTPRGLLTRLGRPLDDLLSGGLADAPHAGLFRRRFGPWTLLWNTGGVGLAHQPGHIHADGLAFELSLHDERVVVDAGVGTYTPGFLRDYARSTRAHSTVTVGEADADQHEMWASHRVGGRARTTDLSHGPDSLEGRLHGYRALASHLRKIRWDGQRLICEDRVEPDAPATTRLFFPESCALLLRGSVWHGRTAGGRRFRLIAPAGTPWSCSPAHGWTAMNLSVPRRCLAAPVPPGGLTLEFQAEPT